MANHLGRRASRGVAIHKRSGVARFATGMFVLVRPSLAYDATVPALAADPRARPIGVFDSGVGGLTVLHELLVALPQEDFVYLGDTARFPYGERIAEELERFSVEIAEELLTRRAKLLVVACNSATSAALRALQQADAADHARRRRARGRAPRGAAGGGAHPHRAHRAAGDADHGRQPARTSDAVERGRPARDAHRRAMPDARRDDPGGGASTSAPCAPCARRARRCARPTSTR